MAKRYGRTSILINSAYRNNPDGTSPTDFIYTFPETVKNVVHTNLLSAVIENGAYNIVSGVNDTFNLNTVGGTGSCGATSFTQFGFAPSAVGPLTYTVVIDNTADAPFLKVSTISATWSNVATTYNFSGTVVSSYVPPGSSFPTFNITINWTTVPTSPVAGPASSYAFVGDAPLTTIAYPIILTPGYYNVQTLSLAMSLALNTQNHIISPANVFVTEVNNQGILRITNNARADWSIGFPQVGFQTMVGFVGGATTNPIPTFLPDPTPNGPYFVYGFQSIYLANYDMLLIQSDRLGNELTSRQGFNAWRSILNGNSLTNSTSITYENTRNPTLECVWKVPRDFEWIDVRLVDIYGSVVDIGANNNMQLVVECYTDDDARQ